MAKSLPAARRVRTRFAPSPTGFLHIGNAYSALIDFAFARKQKGEFIIRIEDTDVKRFVKGAEEKIYEWLGWLGIKADESPKSGGPYGPYRQSERLDLYHKYARELVKKGHAYYCFCSSKKLEKNRKECQKKGQPPMYDRCCRDGGLDEAKLRIKKGEKYVIRLKVPDNEEIVVNDLIRGKVVFESKVVDDQVLIKSDGYPTYHLAVVVDDHLMKVSHVVRGEEWLSSAPKHVLLYRYFGWKEPIWFHNPIIRNPDRSKMGKRQGHAFLSWYQKEGYLPEALLNYLALLGWSHPQEKDVFSLKEFIKAFDLKDVSPVGPVFDLNKLNWINGVYIRKKSNAELLKLLKPFIPQGASASLIKQTIPLVKERLVKLADYPELVDFFLKEPIVAPKLLVQKGKDKKDTRKILTKIIDQLSAISEKVWRDKKLEAVCRFFCDQGDDWSTGKLFMTLRIALTGKTATPPLFETMEVLGKEKALSRLRKAAKLLS